MDKRAESLAQADEEDFAIDLAKNANLGATAIMCRWLRRAEETFGKEHDITTHYREVLGTLKEQHELIWDGDKKAIAEAHKLSLEINKKYGGIKENNISREEHIKRYQKPDGPR